MGITQKLSLMLEHLIDGSLEFGKNLIFAIIVYFIGRYVIKFLMRLIEKIMLRRKLDETLRSFVSNLVKVILQVTLFVFIITILGVRGSSIMALVASAGLGIGLALSGTLQNFANGVLLLLFKPYRVGDYIETQGIGGTVKAIQIFHTILVTSDNKTIYIPNGTMSSSLMTNFNQQKTRRIEWNIGIEYGESFDKVRQTILEVIGTEKRILNSPEPLIELNQLADSQVVVIVRVWVKVDNYWDVYFATNKKIYETFNQKGINFPFPQLTIHQ
ncbi:MAG: mechanosensitive ion channel [Prevotellaceae bacterium]|jgi:small conductance mechanosensitive channel|nr:mechanosensitive ion channel [Prevotellaceae bacterium]